MNHTLIMNISGDKLVQYTNNNLNKNCLIDDQEYTKCSKKDLPFIFIQTNEPELLLKLVNKSRNDSIWKICNNKIKTILCNNKIDPKKYISFGNLWFPTKNNRILPSKLTIPLVNTNKNISKHPKDFIKVRGNVDGMNIWKSIGDDDYMDLSLLASIKKPLINDSIIINKKFIEEYIGKNELNNGKTNMNEFYFLSYQGHNKISINYMHCNDNNIVNINDSRHNINNEMLEIQNEYEKINDYQVTRDIINNNASENMIEKFNNWKSQKGRNVVLIEPNEPWYKNKIKKKLEINSKDHIVDFKINNNINDIQSNDSGSSIKITKKDLPVLETFNNNKSLINPIKVICTLLLLFSLIIIYKKYIKKNKLLNINSASDI